jgi:alpha-N-arabinofuranosidase
MDEYDPKKNVALLLDEWGTWWDVEPGTNPGHLFQQNSMRDAFVASLSLDIFHRYTDRLKMANIAQVVNVLQSMILTDKDRMVLTPTYYVFKMYNVHQDATYLPIDLTCDSISVSGDRTLPLVSATASRDAAGRIHISLSNVDKSQTEELTINLSGAKVSKVSGQILTSASLTDCNTFDAPDRVKPATFSGAKLSKGVLKVKMPAKSIVALELQ